MPAVTTTKNNRVHTHPHDNNHDGWELSNLKHLRDDIGALNGQWLPLR